jgi:hypothetical protein
MPRSTGLTVFLCVALGVLVVSPSIISARAVTMYVPAVVPGYLAQYQVLYDSCHSTDPTMCLPMSGSLNDTSYAALQVIAVAGPSITLQLLTIYKNGTATHQGLTIDVATGTSNFTAVTQGPPGNYFVLAGDLLVTDHIWDSSTAPTFNSTGTATVAGKPRLVNFLNYSSSFSFGGYGFSSSSGFAFDQHTGLIVEISFSFTSTTTTGNSEIKFALGMVDNNIWSTSNLPDFSLSANPTSVPISGGAVGTSTITITRSYGYSGTVKLTATPSSSAVTCSLSSNSLVSGSSDATTLSCSGSSGTYTVSVDGDGGYSIHSTSVAIMITSSASSDFQISHSGPISFQTGNSGKATITITAQNGYSASTTLELTSVPSGLSCDLSSRTISGYGSVTLTCIGQPGSYTVTVKATGGGMSHSTDTPVTVSAAPVSTQPTAGLSMPFVYGGIGLAAIVAGLVAVLLFRRKSGGDVTTPSTAAQA